MATTTQDAIRTQLFIGYSYILSKARKAANGFNFAQLYPIIIVGNSPGLLGCELCRLTGKKQNNLHQILRRAILAGVIYKDDKRYYLTDSGQKAYSTICTEFKPMYQQLIDTLTTEARKHL